MGTRQRGIVLLVVAALVLFIHVDIADFDPEPYGTVSIDSAEAELFAPAGGSPILIYAVSALLFAGRRREIVAALGAPANYGVALPLLVAGLGLGRWADHVAAPELLVPALVCVGLAAAALLGGTRALRAVAVPTLFLIFAFPVPAAVVNLVVWPLQLSTAWSAHLTLGLMGFAAERFGDIVLLDDHSFMVIETCSGMRMIETLVMASALYATLFYRRPGQVVALLLLAPVIGYLVNLLRVLSIIFNPYAEWSTVHETQGVVMLVLGVLLIAGLDHLLARRDRARPRPPRAPAASPPTDPGSANTRVIALSTVLLAAGIANFAAAPASQPDAAKLRAFDIPTQIAGSKARGRKLDRQFYGSVGISRWLHREYDFLGEPVAVQILADDRLDRRGSLVSAKNAIPGRGLIVVSHDTAPLGDGSFVDRYLFAGRNKRILVYHWYEGVRGPLEETVRNTFALERGPTRRAGAALSVRLSTPVRERPDALEEANRRLVGFAEEMRRSLAPVSRGQEARDGGTT
ncbi:MAG: exosortase/archaeosortase family protein [Myxococcota bacterium]|nr:exosortase/archaeosortase family protein [Myxococcota bacterium]